MARLDQSDDPRFPRLKQALVSAQSAELRAGDAIYIPPMCWHHAASLERINALANYCGLPCAGNGQVAGTALDGLMHGILSVKSPDSAERAAWRGCSTTTSSMTRIPSYIFLSTLAESSVRSCPNGSIS